MTTWTAAIFNIQIISKKDTGRRRAIFNNEITGISECWRNPAYRIQPSDEFPFPENPGLLLLHLEQNTDPPSEITPGMKGNT